MTGNNFSQKILKNGYHPFQNCPVLGERHTILPFRRRNSMNTIPMDARTDAIQDTLIAISVVSRQLAGKIEALKAKAKEVENCEQHE